MKQFIDKLIERLEELKLTQNPYDSYYEAREFEKKEEINSTNNKTIEKIIEIVNQLAEEYKNGWISVDDALPKYTDDYNVTVGVCSEFGYYECVKTFRFINIKGKEPKWDIPKDAINLYRVLAWQPLPAPYQQKGE